MPELTLAEIARHTGGALIGDDVAARRVTGVAPLDAAGPAELSFVANARYLPYLHATAAGALLVPESLDVEAPAGAAIIRVKDPHAALAVLLPLLYPEPEAPAGIDPTAVVAPDAELGAGVSVGPFAVIGAGSRLGDGVQIGAHAAVGAGCVIGAGSVVHASATLYRGVVLGERCIVHSGARLGADGFGYVFQGGAHRKVPQVGGCRLGDDVEVGANTTIDRGSIGDTTVGSGTKIDNLVHIGHNCRIGEKVLIVAQVGVSGSTVIGDGAVLGGQAGFAGHITIGAGAKVAAQAGVISDVAPGETVSGYPARPHREALRASAALFRLPKLMARLERLERALGDRS
ncbi:MAG TPA: UDP-3-O-(3-hydroxymyristoyl)glucosamine N-acyltransferase [Longimicrobiaceae bacterium]|nr:UDP-3-O-(3-hydroxymyristoyl)glucosamine N-acyltransferase [Longimicrobiaceae bacterium]